MPSMSEKITSRHFAPGQHEADFEGLLEAVPGALVGVDRAGVIPVHQSRGAIAVRL